VCVCMSVCVHVSVWMGCVSVCVRKMGYVCVCMSVYV